MTDDDGRMEELLEEVCEWKEVNNPLFDDMAGTFDTQCGRVWSFAEGGIKANDVVFCRWCSKKVLVITE